jgi:sterol 3beta-glucosyltransferase
MVLPIRDIETSRKEKAYHWSNFGLVVVIRGHEELFFEFGQEGARDDCLRLLTERIEDTETESIHQEIPSDSILGVPWMGNNIVFKTTKPIDNYQDCYDGLAGDLQNLSEKAEDDIPALMFDSSAVSMVSFKPSESLRFTCLTIGSRGDVQPYIALCKGLQREGHTVKIASHEEYRDWVTGHGIQFAPVEGDPAELMRLCIEHGIFTVSFLKEAHGNFRKWLDGLLVTAWEACQDSDVLIESPSTMAGIHIAEALKIPYFRAFTMPWTRTRTYPHAFAVPDLKMGGGYNYMTYTVFDNLFWRATAGQINRWRKKKLGLKSTNLDKLQVNKVPFLYNFSPSVVPPPLDWVDWIIVTGYWFLDDADSSGTKQWEPPQDVVQFIAKAREDKKKVVYIGFGSIVVSDSRALTQTVIDSVMKAGVRCILAKGWSDRMDDKNVQQTEVPLPDDILSVASVPHDWLFPQIDAAVHHGGAGTTGASLRAGLVTVIKPYFGDQYFWGTRVEDLGVGLCMRKLNVPNFTKALIEATRNEKMIHKAKALGEMLRKVCPSDRGLS